MSCQVLRALFGARVRSTTKPSSGFHAPGRLQPSRGHSCGRYRDSRGELEARQSWTVNGARLAAAGPWVVLAFLATRPETARAYDSAAGVAVLLGGAACSLIAYRLMVRLGRLPEEGRVLR